MANVMGLRARMVWVPFLCVVLCLIAGCSSQDTTGLRRPEEVDYRDQGKGVYHIVKKGQTLHAIAEAYKVSADDIAKANNLYDRDNLIEGYWLLIPGAKNEVDVAIADVPVKPIGTDKLGPVKREGPLAAEANFVWPYTGTVLSKFGQVIEGDDTLKGIRIQAKAGDSVIAAKSGQVSWVSEDGMPGYGRVVAVRHSDGYTTLYGHLSDTLVKKDDWVKQGDVIALAGSTGDVKTAQVYFQVSKGVEEVDPLKLLK